ncbi:MAG: DinB family protein [Ignavibacteriaceae bacterium]
MIEYFFKMIRYNEWANKAALISIQSQGINNEGIMKILSHIILAEQIWMLRMQKGEYENLNFWKVLSLGESSKLIEENSSNYFSYLSKMKERDLKKIIRYKNTKGIEFTNTIEDILTHISHHSAYHRAQIAREIRNLGFNPPLTDYIAFVREISK